MADAPPVAADHVVVMEVAESPCTRCGPHRRTMMRAGQWVREDLVYRDRTETLFADLGTGTSFQIVQDRAGAVQRLKVERYADSDSFHVYRRASTGRHDRALGEPCEIWIVTGEYYNEESCETADGIQLWSRQPSSGSGPDLFAARATSIQRRPVRPDEVRPPRDFFQRALWPRLSAGAGAGYEVRLVSSTRGRAREQIRREQGLAGSGHQDLDGTRYFSARDDRSRYSYQEEAGGHPLELEVELWSASRLGFRRSGDRWVPVPGRRPRSVLGEHCTWQEEISIQSTDTHYECRTRDGIPLMLEDHWDWDSVVDIWIAESLSRRPLADADFAPPPASTDWGVWGVAPAGSGQPMDRGGL